MLILKAASKVAWTWVEMITHTQTWLKINKQRKREGTEENQERKEKERAMMMLVESTTVVLLACLLGHELKLYWSRSWLVCECTCARAACTTVCFHWPRYCTNTVAGCNVYTVLYIRVMLCTQTTHITTTYSTAALPLPSRAHAHTQHVRPPLACYEYSRQYTVRG